MLMTKIWKPKMGKTRNEEIRRGKDKERRWECRDQVTSNPTSITPFLFLSFSLALLSPFLFFPFFRFPSLGHKRQFPTYRLFFFSIPRALHTDTSVLPLRLL